MIAEGFDPNSEEAKRLDRNWDEGGMLILNEKHKRLISSVKNIKGAPLLKFQNVLGYQIELGCDIALAKEMNASTNAGYETIMGVVIISN